MSGSTLLKVGKGEKDPNKANFGVRGKVTIVGYVPNPKYLKWVLEKKVGKIPKGLLEVIN